MNQQLQSYLTEKLHSLGVYVLAMVSAFFAPLIVPVILIGVLAFIDFVTGVRASRKNGKTFILSRAMSRSKDKLTGYGAAIIVAAIIEFIINYSAPLTKICTGVIAAVELQSIRENVKVLTNIDILRDATKFLTKNDEDNGTQNS